MLCMQGIFINWIRHAKSEINLSLKLMFKTGFWVQITFGICVLMLSIHKGYFVVKKMVWNVRIKAFWYAKHISYSFSKKTSFLFFQGNTSSATSKMWLAMKPTNPYNQLWNKSANGSLENLRIWFLEIRELVLKFVWIRIYYFYIRFSYF